MLTLLVAALLQAAGPAPPGATSGAPPAAPSVAPLVVTGRRPTPPDPRNSAPTVERFVERLARPVDGLLPRWMIPVCASVVGLEPEAAAFVGERVMATARLAGAPTGGSGCAASVLVVFGPDREAISAELKNSVWSLVSRDTDNTRFAARQRFYASDQPVRWWRSVQVVPNPANKNVVSLIRSSYLATVERVVIAVDSGAVETAGLTFRQVADYAAMVVLAGPERQDGFRGADSILTLFDARPEGDRPPRALTEWDVGFLKGLYSAEPSIVGKQNGRIKKAVRTVQDGR